VLVKSPRGFDLAGYLRAGWRQRPRPRAIKLEVDVDPQSFL
jgi:hypothetical protein